MSNNSAAQPGPDFETWRHKSIQRLDAAIKRTLDKAARGQPKTVERLLEAMAYTLMAGGKRIRPLLSLAASEAVGGQAREALPAAIAVEMIHAYSLIHDDLPALDNDDLRRGQPTNHRVYGEAMAILAGDALLTLAFQVLAESAIKSRESARRASLAIINISRLAGVTGMVGGQALDLALENQIDQGSASADLVRDMESRKTGALMAAALVGGAAFGNASASELRSMNKIGFTLGRIFQIQDDLLNLQGNPELLGKAVGSDQARGKATLPALSGLDAARRELTELADQARILAALFKIKGLRLLQIIERLMGRQA